MLEDYNTGQGFCGAAVLYTAWCRYHGVRETAVMSHSSSTTKSKNRELVMEYVSRVLESDLISREVAAILQPIVEADPAISGLGLDPQHYLPDWAITAVEPDVPKHLWVSPPNHGLETLQSTTTHPGSMVQFPYSSLERALTGGTHIRLRNNHYVTIRPAGEGLILPRLLEVLAIALYLTLGGKMESMVASIKRPDIVELSSDEDELTTPGTSTSPHPP